MIIACLRLILHKHFYMVFILPALTNKGMISFKKPPWTLRLQILQMKIVN